MILNRNTFCCSDLCSVVSSDISGKIDFRIFALLENYFDVLVEIDFVLDTCFVLDLSSAENQKVLINMHAMYR